MLMPHNQYQNQDKMQNQNGTDLATLLKTLLKDSISQGLIPTWEKLCNQIELRYGLPIQSLDLSKHFQWYQNICHFKFLDTLLEYKEDIEEVIFHSTTSVQVFFGNRRESYALNQLNDADLQIAYEALCLKEEKEWNYHSPFSSFTSILWDLKIRVSLIHHSLTPSKTSRLSIRFFKDYPFKIADFTSLTGEELIRKHLEQRSNIIISGETGSGKTTFLRTMIKEIPNDQHIVTLEDTHELHLTNDHWTPFLSNDRFPQRSLEKFCAYALRFRPDRIILGEIRSTEITPFVMAMNTGHKGLMGTIHANDALDTLNRMGLLFSLFNDGKNIDYETVLKLICQNIDLVVHIKNKKITEIIRVISRSDRHFVYEKLL